MQMDEHREAILKDDEKKQYRMLGQGNTAEIYQYSADTILKLFRENMPYEAIEKEYQLACKIQTGFDQVPNAFKMVEYRNRYGIVYEQIIGRDMIQYFLKHPFKLKYYSRMLASIHVSIHKKEVNLDYSVKRKLSQDIDSSMELTSDEKNRIKQYLEQLPDQNYLCHFDFHPGNVMIQNNQPMVIDWMTACSGIERTSQYQSNYASCRKKMHLTFLNIDIK
ncbi:MAG: phosphotransferase [Clostridia bacterium]|nr:phosphotransferase [Clostridia bacterium]